MTAPSILAAPSVKVVLPGEGETGGLAPGVGVQFKLDGADSLGALAIVEHPFAVGALVPPHIHTREDEYSIVTEGRIGFRSNDQEVVLEAGGYIVKPRGEVHAMWNAGKRPARMIEVIAPAGFEGFFREMAAMTATGVFDWSVLARLSGSVWPAVREPRLVARRDRALRPDASARAAFPRLSPRIPGLIPDNGGVTPTIEVRDNPAELRYEAWLDGRLAGFSEYEPHDGWLVFHHTEVGPEYEGQGVGSRLAQGALDDVRARGLKVTPTCPFISAWIRRHPDYQDMVVGVRGTAPRPGGPRDPGWDLARGLAPDPHLAPGSCVRHAGRAFARCGCRARSRSARRTRMPRTPPAARRARSGQQRVDDRRQPALGVACRLLEPGVRPPVVPRAASGPARSTRPPPPTGSRRRPASSERSPADASYRGSRPPLGSRGSVPGRGAVPRTPTTMSW